MSIGWTVPPSIVDKFFGNRVNLTYRKGQTVFPQGSPADVIYWLQRGIVEIHRSSRDGGRLIVRLAGPGELIGFEDVSDGNGEPVQVFGARARTNCEVALVTREHATKVIEALTPDRLASLLATLNRDWSAEAARLADFLLSDCRERIKLVLVNLANRFGARDERGTVLVPELTHQDLSDLVSFSRAMIGRVLAELLEEGAIANDKGRYVVLRGSELDASLEAKQAVEVQHSRDGSGPIFRSKQRRFAPLSARDLPKADRGAPRRH
jgi:CRP/FNR family transcriptional regulator